jgi:hypothetical protein
LGYRSFDFPEAGGCINKVYLVIPVFSHFPASAVREQNTVL